MTQITSGSLGNLLKTQAETATGACDQIIGTVGFGPEIAVVMTAIPVFGNQAPNAERFDRRLLAAWSPPSSRWAFSRASRLHPPALLPG